MLLLVLLVLLGMLRLTLAVGALVLRSDRTIRRTLIVVDHRAAGKPPEQKGTGDEEHAKVPEPLEEGGYHVTLPYQRCGWVEQSMRD